jgi:hypothetical protein
MSTIDLQRFRVVVGQEALEALERSLVGLHNRAAAEFSDDAQLSPAEIEAWFQFYARVRGFTRRQFFEDSLVEEAL